MLLMFLAQGAAGAAVSDTIHPFVGLSYSYDDNLFRVGENVAVGDLGRSDQIRTAIAGLQFVRPVGIQRIEANVKVSRVSFRKYNQLDYNGKDADLTWFWKLGTHWSGTAGGTYSESLTPFSDFHSTERNMRVQRGAFADANWRFHPSWRIRAKGAKRKYEYDLSSQKFLDRDEDTGELGFDYLAASGSTVGLLARRIKGDYPNHLSYGTLVLNESYTQQEYRLAVNWLATPLTQFQFEGGRVNRSHEGSTLRDSSGNNGRLTASWSPRATLKFSGAAWREFAPYEGALVAYSLEKGGSVGATWTPGYRVQVDGQIKSVKRNFGSGLSGVPLNYDDRTKSASLGLTYAFRDNISLGASLFRETRSIDARYGSAYRANGGSVSANLQF